VESRSVSRVLSRTVIPLRRPSLDAFSNLPGSSAAPTQHSTLSCSFLLVAVRRLQSKAMPVKPNCKHLSLIPLKSTARSTYSFICSTYSTYCILFIYPMGYSFMHQLLYDCYVNNVMNRILLQSNLGNYSSSSRCNLLYDIQLPNASQEMASVNRVIESFMCKKERRD